MLLEIGRRPDAGFDEPLRLLSDCHRRIEHFLHVLRVIARDAAGGALSDAQRSQLEGALAYFATAAPRHTADEEKSLFPRLKDSRDPDAARALDLLARLEHDHGVADEHHRRVDVLARQWLAAGALPAAETGELAARLDALQDIYARHIAAEDGTLFPAAARILSRDQITDIGREMAARRRQ
jgi:hemerythrin-like domain-containing protein